MSDLDDRSGGRRKGLFRRNRSDSFTTPAPWAADEWDAPLDEDAPLDPHAETDLDGGAAPVSAPRRRTSADMFAGRDRGWTEAWGDDAVDDEWRDPAFRRPSIPAAASPQPAEVDAWLDEDAEDWSDVTRENALRWGGTAGSAAEAHAPAVATAAASASPATSVSSVSSVSLSDDPVERALATVAHTSIDLTDGPEADADAMHVESIVSGALGDAPERQATASAGRSRFRRTRTAPQAAQAVRTAPVVTDAPVGLSGDEAVVVHRISSAVVPTPVQPAPDTSDGWDDPSDATGPMDELPGDDPVAAADVAPASDHKFAYEPADVPDRFDRGSGRGDDRVDDASDEFDELDDDPADDDRADDGRGTDPVASGHQVARREVAFSDRATWIGAMVAALAAARLVFSVASGMRQANPEGEQFGLITRIGRGMAELGVSQGALLVLAVVLISLPTLVDPRASRRFDTRIAGGLGFTLGAAAVGLIGALFAWFAERKLAGIGNTGGGATSVRLLGDLVVTGGLCVVALAGALRALRSFHD